MKPSFYEVREVLFNHFFNNYSGNLELIWDNIPQKEEKLLHSFIKISVTQTRIPRSGLGNSFFSVEGNFILAVFTPLNEQKALETHIATVDELTDLLSGAILYTTSPVSNIEIGTAELFGMTTSQNDTHTVQTINFPFTYYTCKE